MRKGFSFLIICFYLLLQNSIGDFAWAEGYGDPVTITTANGLCLDVKGGVLRNGNPVIVWPCHGGENQTWFMHSDGIIEMSNNKCLDLRSENESNRPGVKAIIWTCHGRHNQRWWPGPRNSLRSGTNLCLDVKGGRMRPGDEVIMWPCHGGRNQRWIIRD